MIRRIAAAGVAFAVTTPFALAQTPPKVVSLDPPHLSANVDPHGTTRFTVVFDRDMDTTAHSVCGAGPTFPKITLTEWENDRTFVFEAQLGEDRIYSIDLSCASSNGFRSKQGDRLPLVPWRIATKGPALDPATAARAVATLFTAIGDRYSYRDRLGIDWRDIQRTHQEELLANKHGAALALSIAQLMQSAQDPHVTVTWRDGMLATCQREIAPNFDVRGLQKALTGLRRIGRIGMQAKTDDGIGYLFVGSFSRDQREDFDAALDALRGMLDCKALVLDVRTNTGGDELIARRLAAWFVPGEKIYAAHRIRDPKAEGGFQTRQDRRLRGNEPPELFEKPVAVLMGQANMSSCEAFLLMMKQAPNAVLVGDTSYGSSGNPQAWTLAPGLTVMLPSWQALRADGTPLEGEGITPHIHVATTPAKLAEEDTVLAEALLRLRGIR